MLEEYFLMLKIEEKVQRDLISKLIADFKCQIPQNNALAT